MPDHANNGPASPFHDMDPTNLLRFGRILRVLAMIAVIVGAIIVVGRLPLTFGTWRLVSYGPVDAPRFVPAEIEVTADFDLLGGVSGHAACNYYSGFRYRVRGTALRISASSHLGMTAMACSPEILLYEGIVLAHFPSVTAYRRRYGELILFYEGGSLRFHR